MVEGLEMICFKIISNVEARVPATSKQSRKQSRETLRSQGMYKGRPGDVPGWT